MTQRRPSSPSRPPKSPAGRPQRPKGRATGQSSPDAVSDGGSANAPVHATSSRKDARTERRSDSPNRALRADRRPQSDQTPKQGMHPGADAASRRDADRAPDRRVETLAAADPVRHSPAQPDTGGDLTMPTGDAAMQPGEVRLNKAIAGAGVCSRRQADDLILQGVVRVNDEVVNTPGARVVPGRDRIEVRGQMLALDAAPAAFTYVMLHKPVQVVSTVRDPQGRATVLGILPPDLRGGRLYPVGRLDYFSEGLLILTDDGELTNRLTHPRYHLPKVYMVKVRGHVTEAALAPMRKGMTLAEGEQLAPVEVRLLQSERQASLIEMTLHQGVNRQVRRMCRDLGLTVLLLRRVRQGPLELGELPKGAARRLTAHEVTALRRAAGLES